MQAYEWEKILTIEQFLQELESHCETTGIVTLSSGFAIDIKRSRRGMKYGYQSNHKPLFLSQFKETLGVVLRTFKRETVQIVNMKGQPIEIPVKALRMYFVELRDQELRVCKVTPEACFAAQNTDAETGEVLPFVSGIEYC
ncbi:MAG: hypothetical protein H7Y37_15110 [Anaerolineae bacterium]|nr:hypothetical protein [Gloeobacterales cyanobacterium ES-bin-313]